MKKLLILALLLPGVVVAGQFTATWIHPTANTDASPLPLAQIASTRVEWGTCVSGAFGTKIGETVVPAPAVTTTVNNVAPGTICVQARTTANGNESAPSLIAQKVIPQPTPNPPTLTVTVADAYQIKQKGNGMEIYYAGQVELGTVCGEQLVAGLYQVPNSAVTYAKKPYETKPTFAQCG